MVFPPKHGKRCQAVIVHSTYVDRYEGEHEEITGGSYENVELNALRQRICALETENTKLRNELAHTQHKHPSKFSQFQ